MQQVQQVIRRTTGGRPEGGPGRPHDDTPDTSTPHHGTPHHSTPHNDTPDTDAAFRRLAALPEGPARESLREQLILVWMPLASRLSHRYRNRGESDDDLRQVALLGLVKAVDRFDPARGLPFIGFAVPTISGEIKRHFRDHSWSVHVPRRVQELRSQVRAARGELTRGVDTAGPSIARIAAHTGLSEADVRLGASALDSYAALSLDADGAHATLLDAVGRTDPAIALTGDRESVKPWLARLPTRERTILYLRFFDDMTQGQIAEVFGISQMHVSRLLSTTFARIRAQVMTEAAAH
jgi:RNA polymerase sigma-B factor